MSNIKKLEEEYAVASELAKRLERLRQKQPEYFRDRHKIFEAFAELEREFLVHLKEDKEFLEGLPQKVQERIDKDKALLELRKQILEMLKDSE